MKRLGTRKPKNTLRASRELPATLPATHSHGIVRDVMIAIVLSVLTFAIFYPATHGEILAYDDNVYIDSDGHARQTPRKEDQAFANWHPLSWASLRLDDRIFTDGAFGHHFGNVLLHALSAAVVFLLARQMTEARWRAALVAALFAFHPLRVEPVAWISERKEVQAAFFGFLTLLAYFHYCRSIRPAPRIAWYLAVLGLLAVGLFSKPTLVTLPLVMLLLDFWPMRRIRWSGNVHARQTEDVNAEQVTKRSPVALLIEKIPLFALVAISAAVTYEAQKRGGALELDSDSGLSFPMRASNAVVSYVRYLGKMVWFGSLTAQYPLPQRWPIWAVAGSVCLLAAVTAVAFLRLRRSPWVAVGWLWFLGTLVPMIGLMQAGYQAMADRYAYIPSVGLAIAVVFSLPDLFEFRAPVRLAYAGSALAALVALCYFSVRQIGYWHDTTTLWGHALEVTSNNWMAEREYANALSRQSHFEAAIPHFRAAITLVPDDTDSSITLGKILLSAGRIDEARDVFEQALRHEPNSERAENGIGIALAASGHVPEALAEFRHVVAMAPAFVDGRMSLAKLLARTGHEDEAVFHFRAALKLEPTRVDAHLSFGNALMRWGRLDEAIAEFSEACRLRPDDKNAEKLLNIALQRRGAGS